MIYWILVLPGLAAIYVMFIRKLLEGVPALKKFYAEANGFWAKVWAICGKSATMAWSYFLAFVGGLLNQLDNIAAMLGDPSFKDQVAAFLHADPKWMGYFAIAVAVVTIVARLRSIIRPTA